MINCPDFEPARIGVKRDVSPTTAARCHLASSYYQMILGGKIVGGAFHQKAPFVTEFSAGVTVGTDDGAAEGAAVGPGVRVGAAVGASDGDSVKTVTVGV